MHRRNLLIGMSNLAAGWRAMLSALFTPASATRAAVILGAADMEAQSKPEALKAIVGPVEHNPPSFEDYASIEARANGEPVYGLDYMMYIYRISPDLMPGIVMQRG